MAKYRTSKGKKLTKVGGYRSASSYAGKSVLQMVKSIASSDLTTAVLKKALGLNTETKWLDTIETNASTSSTASSFSFALAIPQGDSCNSRQGNSVRLTSMIARLRIQANPAATTPCLVRVVFFKVKENRGDNPTAATVLDSTTRITSSYNMGDSAAATGYTVLFDRTIQINVATSDDSTKLMVFKYNPLQHHLKWSSADTTGNYANLQDGYIRGFIMTSETGANTPSYWLDQRIKFVDN